MSTNRQIVLSAGFVLLATGALWSLSFPNNKTLSASSYALYAAGWSVLLLAVGYFVVEICSWRGRWMSPGLAFRANTIVACVFSELLSSAVAAFHVNPRQSLQDFAYQDFFPFPISPSFGSLIYSALISAICFVPAWRLFRRNMVVKL